MTWTFLDEINAKIWVRWRHSNQIFCSPLVDTVCNMRYLYWSWYLHMCADVSCLTFWQLGWLPCALCSAAAGLTLVLQVFQNIWHIWQPQTGTPSSTPMDFYCADWKEIFHFHFMPLRIWSMKEKTCQGSVFDLGWEILRIMTWQDYTSKSSASRLLELLGDSQY